MGVISGYAAATTITDDDVLLGNDGATTKKFPFSVIKTKLGSLELTRTLGNADVEPVYDLNVDLDYQITDIAGATTVGLAGVRSQVRYGSQGAAIAATGSVLAMSSEVIIRNAAQAGAEQAAFYGVLRYDQDGVNGGSTPGRAWLTDFTVHGAKTVQQQILTGINLVMANYYNGQPSESPSVGICLAAGTAIGGSFVGDGVHDGATRYPNGVGIAIVGRTSSDARGWDVGLQIGGAGGSDEARGGWNVTASRLGVGAVIRDYETAGLRIHSRYSGATGPALLIESNAGPVIVGKATSTPQSTVATVAGTFAAPAADPASQMISFLSNDAQASGRGASIGLGGTTTNDGATFRNFALLAGRKANGTTADTSGYLQVQINKSGVGLQQVLRIDIDSAWTLLDGTTINLGSTTGTKLGTAITEKLGLYGVTPVAQRAGAAQAAVDTTAATQTSPWGFASQAQADAIVTLVNELRAALVALGPIKGSA